MIRLRILAVLCLCCLFYKSRGAVSSNCPNSCSSHGVCTNTTSVGTCECFPSFTGIDCSLRVCPSSTAWVDVPSTSLKAHAPYTECSNMGYCDRSTGICKCRAGFEGAACDTMMCPVGTLTSSIPEGTNITAICSGNGRCASLREATRYQTFTARLDYQQYAGWDADKIRGCICEEGWTGIACENRLCPKGDDPLTVVTQGASAPEVQIIDCRCTDCKGGLYISFKGQQTPLIPYDASAELIQYRINQFTSVGRAEVTIVQGSQMCSLQGSATRITFILPQGPQPSIAIVRGGGLKSLTSVEDISVRAKGLHSNFKRTQYSAIGQRDLIECSNRGTCDRSTGICTCFPGFTSSNGLGGNGTINDCGYQYAKSFTYKTADGLSTFTTTCPVDENSNVCSGHGTCNGGGICTCDSGYSGPSCAEMRCSSTFAWFGNVNADHSSAESSGVVDCGGVGTCDTATGYCSKCGGHWGVFTGDRCQYFTCPLGNNGKTCGENGACLTLSGIGRLHYNEEKELAAVNYDTPWDANLMKGCSCLRAITVDGQYDFQYARMIDSFFYNDTTNSSISYADDYLHKFYRGPYAYAATDFKGYACEKAWCPKGDNPRTSGGLNEIQRITCQADNGTFMIGFRENVTLPVNWNDTLADFTVKLEQLYTIGQVKVTSAGHTSLNSYNGNLCSTGGDITVDVEFLTEYGDLPMMKAYTGGIQSIAPALAALTGTAVMNIVEYQKGTKEDMECSGQGVCNEDTGQCGCFEGFGSSDGTWENPGERGDCTFFNKLYTATGRNS